MGQTGVFLKARARTWFVDPEDWSSLRETSFEGPDRLGAYLRSTQWRTPGDDDRPLQGAACHACLLVPETSCEARNTRLDRNLLIQTITRSNAGLFPDEAIA